jgi:hypothetical protein
VHSSRRSRVVAGMEAIMIGDCLFSGSAKEIMVTFSPDHSSQYFSDVCYVDLFGNVSFQVKINFNVDFNLMSAVYTLQRNHCSGLH